MLAAGVALLLAASAAPARRVFSVKNATAAPVRCLLMAGGPITHLITIPPGRENSRLIGAAATASLACPKLRDTVFGPLPPGRYVLRRVKGRVELAPAQP